MEAETPKESSESYPELLWIDNITRLMDTSFRLPGTQFRFGLDPIIGFIPFAGNIITYFIAAVMVLAMGRYGVSNKVVIIMILNVALDYLIGVIPVIGTIFDAGYKANYRNLKLLKSHYHEDKHQGSGWWILGVVALSLFAVFMLVTWLAFKTLGWLYSQISLL